MRETITVTENDARYAKLLNKANEGLVPSNLQFAVRGEKNKKPFPGIEKNGLTFYVTGEVPDDERMMTIYKGNPSRNDVATARKNTIANARIGDLMDTMSGEMSRVEDWNHDGNPMIILTNKEMRNGAGVLLCDAVLKAVYKKIGRFYILPSSIHEVILVPERFGSPEEFSSMVKTINATNVIEEEQLSDEVYLYNGKTWKLA